MPPLIPRLRRWLVAAAIALICLVAAFYFNSRNRVQNALKQVPKKIGLEIQQSAKGFTISKSLQGHTLFKIEASRVVQFKGGRRGELHDVEITVYGHDSGRFDRIAGKDFEYDAVTGDIVGKGEVQIDLESNPAGVGTPDQSIPNSLRNPVHLKTSDLVFNQKTGDAHADGEIDFSVPQATGSALGLTYEARSAALTLNSKIKVNLNGFPPILITADRLKLSRVPRMLMLEHPHVIEGPVHTEADKATAFLSQENTLERVQAQGHVLIGSDEPDGGKITAGELELKVGAESTLRQASLAGNVQFETLAGGGMHGTAGRTVLHFGQGNTLDQVHADQGVSLTQAGAAKTGKQNFELTAPEVDFLVAEGRLIRRAETSGPPQITISGAGAAGDVAVISAGKFDANFDDKGQLTAVHGAPNSRIVSKSGGGPDRVSTGEMVDAGFHQGGIATLVQKGNFAYSDGRIKAWADSARYALQDQMLLLEGAPRFADGGMTTTAQTIRLNRSTGTAYAEGDVKTSDGSLRSNTGGGLFSASKPIHVTAGSMTVTRNPLLATFRGSVRLWQDANSVEAPSIEFNRDQGSVLAVRTASERVSTSLSQSDKQGRITALTVLADRLTYSQSERSVHFAGNVMAASRGISMTAANMDCFLQDQTQTPKTNRVAASTQVDRIVATGGVVITQTGRHVTGDQLVYTAAEDKFVMTGGPASIFEAEHGNVTGVSLTLFGHDGRVLVEGNNQSPAVTEIRVAR